MIRRCTARLWSWLVVIAVLNSLAAPHSVLASERIQKIRTQSDDTSVPHVVQATHHDVSPALTAITTPLSKERGIEFTPEIPTLRLPKSLKGGEVDLTPEAYAAMIPNVVDEMPAPLWDFEGVNNLFGGYPPDTQGDIGPDHYVQWINLHFAIWEIDRESHSASLVYGPVPGNTLFQGFGGVCENNNDGDPITLYDPFDNRWFMSQFALPNYPNGPFYQCIAVSNTSDPTGSWNRYVFQMPVNKMNDYPKFGVWPNAYFMTINQFNAGTLSNGGAGVAAFERSAMLAGAPARMVFFDLYNVNPDFSGILPADFDGRVWPPVGTPGYFAEWDDSSWIGSVDALRVWEFRIDWADPGEASFGLDGQPNWIIPTLNVDPTMCNMQRNCIPQPGTTTRVDAISDRLMYRLQYRNFGSYASLVSNHTVDVDGTDHAGIHWFELRKDALGVSWELHQQGIYSPDAEQRWMGSAAIDHVGNLALGYSLSSGLTHPSVRYTGRLAGDPLGSLPQGEQTIISGTGSQTGSSRWGDYSMMGLDPVDDCTFWYTQQYVAVTGTNTWRTRIGAFRFPSCSIGPQGEITGHVTESSSGNPIPGAQITASLNPTQTLTTHTNAEGEYLVVAQAGLYDLDVSAYGYYSQSLSGVEIISGTRTIQDFALDIAPTHVISGHVRDALTGWPLYARITPIGAQTEPVWSDPLTGFYSLELPEGTSFTLSVEAYSEGYQPSSALPGPLVNDITINFELSVNAETCQAPGYEPVITPFYSSDFEADSGNLTPGGVTSWAWGNVQSGPDVAHSGLKAWATNLTGDYMNNENGTLLMPPVDLSVVPGARPALQWWQWLNLEARYDFASIEASKDGGLSWQTIYGPLSGMIDSQWVRHTIFLDPSFAVSNLLIRFRFISDVSITFEGWYIDDLRLGTGECVPQPGSMVIGNVRDGNTLQGLDFSIVENEIGGETETFSNPSDPNLDGGFYLLFTPSGSHTFTATYGTAYLPDQQTVLVPLNSVVRQDFELQAGFLAYEPPALEAVLELGETLTRPLTLTNSGGAAVLYELVELRGGVIPLGPFETPNFAVKPFKANFPTTEGLGVPADPLADPLAAGDVIRDWMPGDLTGAWAASYDFLNDSIWVSSPAPLWGGSDRLVEFSPEGIPTGRSYMHAPPHSSGPADLALNWNTGNLWIMNVNTGIANCIYEFDPDQGYTGARICPGDSTGFAISQRGLAYDPDTDTWFAGSWNDQMIHRFDSAGVILESVNVGIAVSGLAYNPESRHLFAMTNNTPTRVYVLDVDQDYSLLGSFTVSQGFTSYSGGGLEFDCDGNLWAIDLGNGHVVQLESGETASLCVRDVPWINTQPISGTLTASSFQPIAVSLDAGAAEVDQPGEYTMQIKINEDSPYLVPNIPVTMTVSPPPTWGKLQGSIRGLGYCDQDPHPLNEAEVQILTSAGISWTVTSDISGHYQYWLDEAGSPFTVTFSAAEHLPIQITEVQVSAMLTNTLNQDLFWEKPCVDVSPENFDLSLKTGRSITRTLSLANSGHADTPFSWLETIDDGGQNPPLELDWLSVLPEDGLLAADPNVLEVIATFDASKPGASLPGVYTASLVLESADPQKGSISIPVTMTVLPLEYGVTLAPNQVGSEIPGQSLVYTLTVTNTSEGLMDTIFLSLEPQQWPTQLSTTFVGPISSGSAEDFNVEVLIPETAIPGQIERLVVRASSNGDPNKTAFVELVSTAQQPESDLQISQTISQDPALVGLPLTYTLKVLNNGPTTAPHAMLVNVLSTRVDYLSDDSNCSLDGTLLSCDLGALNPGEERTIRVVVRPMRPGLLVNQALVTSEAFDANMGDNFSALHGLVQGFVYFFPWAIVN